MLTTTIPSRDLSDCAREYRGGGKPQSTPKRKAHPCRGGLALSSRNDYRCGGLDVPLVLLLLPLLDPALGGFVLGLPLFGELLGLVLLGLVLLGLVELGLLELGLAELGLLESGLVELGLVELGLLLLGLDGLLLLGEADELSGEVLELLPVLGVAEL
jgi:hypothetical protein